MFEDRTSRSLPILVAPLSKLNCIFDFSKGLHVCTHVCVSVYTCVYIHTYMCAHMYMLTEKMETRVCESVYVCVCARARVYVYVRVCVCA